MKNKVKAIVIFLLIINVTLMVSAADNKETKNLKGQVENLRDKPSNVREISEKDMEKHNAEKKTDVKKVEKVEKKNKGVFATIGDSISARDTQSYNDEKPYKGYQQFIKEGLDMEGYINLGISGATIARGTEYLRGLSKIAMDYTLGDVDFIIVQAGTNDFALNVPLGNKSELTKKEPDRYNFYGGYSGLVKDLKRNNENVDIYLWTPTQRDCKKFKGTCVNENGNSLKEYVDIIKEVGKHHDVNVVDMYNIKNISQETLRKYTEEGLHLNNDGYRVVANKFMEEYEKINKKKEGK